MVESRFLASTTKATIAVRRVPSWRGPYHESEASFCCALFRFEIDFRGLIDFFQVSVLSKDVTFLLPCVKELNESMAHAMNRYFIILVEPTPTAINPVKLETTLQGFVMSKKKTKIPTCFSPLNQGPSE